MAEDVVEPTSRELFDDALHEWLERDAAALYIDRYQGTGAMRFQYAIDMNVLKVAILRLVIEAENKAHWIARKQLAEEMLAHHDAIKPKGDGKEQNEICHDVIVTGLKMVRDKATEALKEES